MEWCYPKSPAGEGDGEGCLKPPGHTVPTGINWCGDRVMVWGVSEPISSFQCMCGERPSFGFLTSNETWWISCAWCLDFIITSVFYIWLWIIFKTFAAQFCASKQCFLLVLRLIFLVLLWFLSSPHSLYVTITSRRGWTVSISHQYWISLYTNINLALGCLFKLSSNLVLFSFCLGLTVEKHRFKACSP